MSKGDKPRPVEKKTWNEKWDYIKWAPIEDENGED